MSDIKDFKLDKHVEDTLNLYVSKLEEFITKLDDDKKDIISQKSKVLEAILNTDMLKIE